MGDFTAIFNFCPQYRNDAPAHLKDIYAYHDTVDMVKKFVDENPGTVLISTSDHETGGFTLARQVSSAYPEYLWYPDVISRVKNSTIVLANAIHDLKGASNVEEQRVVTERVITEGLGITDATDEEVKFLLSNPSRSALDHFLADMISIRAQLGVSPALFISPSTVSFG
jgi:alkaline phosphatase